jgi:hypothetical protein
MINPVSDYPVRRTLASIAMWLCVLAQAAAQQGGTDMSGHPAEGVNMALVGFHDLQGRSAYQPVIQEQNGKWISYIGLIGSQAENPATGNMEWSGTLILDVSDPAKPVTLAHITGSEDAANREGSGAQMNRVCAINGKTYLLRSFGSVRHELWDVTDPAAPEFIVNVADGLTSVHKNWWECDTGIAYLVVERPGWRSRMTSIYDLKDPHNPVFIRDFGLDGQQSDSAMEHAPIDLHGPIVLGNRVYFGYGSSRGGIIQIVDREKLLKGPVEPTTENLAYPQIGGRLDIAPYYGAHTTFPVVGMEIADYRDNLRGATRNFLVMPSEATQNECREFRHGVFFVDITHPETPMPVANYQVPEAEGDFCGRGGRFGPHAVNESMTPIYYKKIVFISYFNAGVRALDIRNPYQPREIAHYIPATNGGTMPSCVVDNEIKRCKIAVQTNNVEVDDRGYIYIVDRMGTGMHILELTGEAREIANLP